VTHLVRRRETTGELFAAEEIPVNNRVPRE